MLLEPIMKVEVTVPSEFQVTSFNLAIVRKVGARNFLC